jgi:hypothetical protein
LTVLSLPTPALLLKAQDLSGDAGTVGHKSRSRLLGHHREGGIVDRQIAFGDPAVGRFDRGNPGQRQLFGQAILESSQGALGTSPRFGREGRDMTSAELSQGAIDLGARRTRDPLASLRRMKIMTAPVGVELAKQALLVDYLGDAAKARQRTSSTRKAE